MPYQSSYTGQAIDEGISINATQNQRLTNLENKDIQLQNSINQVSNNLSSLTSSFNTLKNEFDSIKSMLRIVLRIVTTNLNATITCTGGTLLSNSSGKWEFQVPSYGNYTVNYTANGATTAYTFEAKYFGINEYKLNYEYIMQTSDFVNFRSCSSSVSGNMYNGYAGFTIVGTNSANNPEGQPRLDFQFDLTYVQKIVFMGRKNANHGNIYCEISDGVKNNGMVSYGQIGYSYGSLGTSWQEYTFDTSKITGIKTISFEGGYSDSTGYTSSSSSFGYIRFIY